MRRRARYVPAARSHGVIRVAAQVVPRQSLVALLADGLGLDVVPSWDAVVRPRLAGFILVCLLRALGGKGVEQGEVGKGTKQVFVLYRMSKENLDLRSSSDGLSR